MSHKQAFLRRNTPQQDHHSHAFLVDCPSLSTKCAIFLIIRADSLVLDSIDATLDIKRRSSPQLLYHHQ
eukprot:c17667_g1_i1 orf=272-478(+)